MTAEKPDRTQRKTASNAAGGVLVQRAPDVGREDSLQRGVIFGEALGLAGIAKAARRRFDLIQDE